MDSKTKYKLFKQSKNFCVVPWTTFELFTNGNIKTCGIGKTKFGNINNNSITNILTSEKMQTLKQNMLDDIPNPNCVMCQHRRIDDNHKNFTYLKDHYNSRIIHEDVDYSDIKNFDMRFIDLHWSNICNLRCVMCHPDQSSLIAKDENIIIPEINNENIKQITKMILDKQWQMKEIYMSGGEPFYIPHNVTLLSQLENKEIPLRINTNMHWLKTNKLYKILQTYKNVQLTMSADGLEEQFEYIRSGSKWETFINNLQMIKKDTNFGIRINTIFSVINAKALPNLLDYFYSTLDIKDITINLVIDPKELDAINYPENKKQNIIDNLYQALDKIAIEHTNLRNNIKNCIKHIAQPKTHSYIEYLNHMTRKNTKPWIEVFKDLA